MQTRAFQMPVPLRDAVSGLDVHVHFSGTATYEGAGSGTAIDAGLPTAVAAVLNEKLAQQQVGMPTLSMSLAHFIPEIVAAAGPHLASEGITLTQLQLECVVPESATAPAAAAIAAAPTVMESVSQSLQDNVAAEVASNVPNRLNVNVGGFKIGVGSGGKIDEAGFVGQIKSKIFDNMLGCAIVAGVVVMLGCIVFGVLLKIILGF